MRRTWRVASAAGWLERSAVAARVARNSFWPNPFGKAGQQAADRGQRSQLRRTDCSRANADHQIDDRADRQNDGELQPSFKLLYASIAAARCRR